MITNTKSVKPKHDTAGVASQQPYVSVAPMMDWTDRHCRYFHRLISPNSVLFTEMITTGALIHGDRDRFLRFDKTEHPLVIQLGGDTPSALAECAKMAEDYSYDEVNLNCGCPSDRVQSGNFGACLMAQPELVAESVDAMIQAVDIPVTVKCRIAIDDYDDYDFLYQFIKTVSEAGCNTFTVHARKAWLKGLSPKENRDIPPLRYDIVKEIKNNFPEQKFVLNGGIKTITDIKEHLTVFDGVMIGREAYQNPYFLACIENEVFNNTKTISRKAAAEEMISYIEQQAKDYGTPIKSITRHMIGLFHQQTGAKSWRRYISENAHKEGTRPDFLKEAMSKVA
jgi:tRNA-dihydrouridine synthase A